MDRTRPTGVSRRLQAPFASTSTSNVRSVILLVIFVVCYSLFMNLKPQQRRGFFSTSGCDFPAIFNFGDSNSDTGGKSAAFHQLPSPNGDTFFHKPSGRYCDGLVIIDFLAEKLGLPFLSAYLDSIGTIFQHGANFATGGSTIQPVDARIFEGGYSPISLDVQVLQFEQFKARTEEMYDEGAGSYVRSSLPRPEDFSNALYTFDIGQNDLDFGLKFMTEEKLKESVPGIIDQLVQAVEKLYQLGARAFWIHNTGPIGCLPYSVIYYPPKPGNMDKNGCIISHNEVAQEFNKHLKDRVSQLRLQHPDAEFTYVDVYSAKLTLISEAEKHGFTDPLGYCCGHYGDYRLQCGKTAIINGTEYYGAECGNPSNYISWDGIHYSHAANQWVANKILDGSLSNPPIPVTEACRKPVHV